MNRRGFLATLGAAVAGFALDPERLLWVPGQKTIFLPPAKPSLLTTSALTTGDIFTIQGVYAINPVTGAALSHLQNFVVTANVSSGELPMKAVFPQIRFDGEYRNASGVLAPRTRINPLFVGDTVAHGRF